MKKLVTVWPVSGSTAYSVLVAGHALDRVFTEGTDTQNHDAAIRHAQRVRRDIAAAVDDTPEPQRRQERCKPRKVEVDACLHCGGPGRWRSNTASMRGHSVRAAEVDCRASPSAQRISAAVYAEYATVREIGAELGISGQRVHQIMRKEGIETRSRRQAVKPERQRQIAEEKMRRDVRRMMVRLIYRLVDAGRSEAEIIKWTGYSRGRVCYWLRQRAR